MFALIWMALLSCFSMIVGMLALFGVANAEIAFWSGNAVERQAGKIIWIVISAMLLVVFSALAVSGYRKKIAR